MNLSCSDVKDTLAIVLWMHIDKNESICLINELMTEDNTKRVRECKRKYLQASLA